jgi:hypothetical protein
VERLNLSKFAGESLLQSGELPKVREIVNPENISEAMLSEWLEFAREVCRKKDYMCLAFSQLKPDVLSALGFSDTLPPRLFYNRHAVSEPGELILNPSIGIPLVNEKVPILEGCGSIDYGRIFHFIKRPQEIYVSGYFFDGQNFSKSSYEYLDPYSDWSIHEVDHLNGKTAMDSPRDFVDIRYKKEWEYIKSWYPALSTKELISFISNDGRKEVLVFDRKMRDFVRAPIGEINSR